MDTLVVYVRIEALCSRTCLSFSVICQRVLPVTIVFDLIGERTDLVVLSGRLFISATLSCCVACVPLDHLSVGRNYTWLSGFSPARYNQLYSHDDGSLTAWQSIPVLCIYIYTKWSPAVFRCGRGWPFFCSHLCMRSCQFYLKQNSVVITYCIILYVSFIKDFIELPPAFPKIKTLFQNFRVQPSSTANLTSDCLGVTLCIVNKFLGPQNNFIFLHVALLGFRKHWDEDVVTFT